MTEGKPNDSAAIDPVLAAAAAEELASASAVDWAALSRVTPWGDAYEGFAADGSAVTFERAYVWAQAVGGDILCEVTVFLGPADYEGGAQIACLIFRPDLGK